MATLQLDNDVTLPHAALLSYFRRPVAAPGPELLEASPPTYNESNALHKSLLTGISETAAKDEESNCGFRNERIAALDTKIKSFGSAQPILGKHYSGSTYAFCCFWCSVSICILAAYGIFFAIDLGFSQYGLGTGLAQWMIYGHTQRLNAHHEVQFCLAEPNRQAPGPQTWRYIAPRTYNDCTTEILTLLADSGEQWKIRPGDEVNIGDNMHRGNREE